MKFSKLVYAQQCLRRAACDLYQSGFPPKGDLGKIPPPAKHESDVLAAAITAGIASKNPDCVAGIIYGADQIIRRPVHSRLLHLPAMPDRKGMEIYAKEQVRKFLAEIEGTGREFDNPRDWLWFFHDNVWAHMFYGVRVLKQRMTNGEYWLYLIAVGVSDYELAGMRMAMTQLLPKGNVTDTYTVAGIIHFGRNDPTVYLRDIAPFIARAALKVFYEVHAAVEIVKNVPFDEVPAAASKEHCRGCKLIKEGCQEYDILFNATSASPSTVFKRSENFICDIERGQV